MAAGIDIDLHVDMELLQARMKNLGAAARDFTRPGKEAAEIVKKERNKRTGSSGHFASVAYTSSTQRKGALVGLRNTGHGSNDYIGVNEFGGSVPRHNSKYRSHFKPWIGGGAGSSYYLYPALEDKRPEITEKYQQEVKRLCDRYMP